MPQDPSPTKAAPDGDLRSRVAGQPAWLSGARGFIGSHLAARLEELGAPVTSFEGDIRDRAAVQDSIEQARPALLFNLAARVDVHRDPALEAEMQATIVGGAVSVYEAAAALGTQPRLLQCGTCEEYGTIAAPFCESDLPSEPVSPYSSAKLAATRALLQRAAEGRVRVVVARPFLTYGPGQANTQLVPAAVDAALSGRPLPMTRGEQTREFNFVSDTVDGLIRAATTDAVVGSIINVGSGDERRILDVARLIFELAGADPSLLQPGARPERSGEVRRFFADVRRCQELLGHRPRVSLEEGLARTIESAGGSQAGERAG